MSYRSSIASLAAFAALQSCLPGAETPDSGEVLFARDVWPLLSEKCIACHGGEKIKGGLDLRTPESVQAGGDSEEPVLVAGKPDASAIYLASLRTHDFWEPMPPKDNDALTAEQIDSLKRWIAAGAAWPDEGRRAELRRAVSESHRQAGMVTLPEVGGLSPEWTERPYKPEDLWAYQPIRKQQPDHTDSHPIDAFLKDAQADLGVTPAPIADRRTLIRRVTYSLTGLPPSPEDVDAFLNDTRNDSDAFTALVDRLLDSPHYGEKWAQHWLDVVRYADSSGFANDFVRGNAWRYRDYVIRSFNDDKPYDQFVREQIAGDEIDPKNPELLIASGFLRMGPWELTAMEVPKVARQRFLDDATDIVGQTFLGHMLQCARCHDHKFDPIPTRDYYSMQAIFATTQLAERKAAFLPEESREGFEEHEWWLGARRKGLQTLGGGGGKDKTSLKAAREWLIDKGREARAFDSVVAQLTKETKRDPKLDEVRRQMAQQKVHPDLIPPPKPGYTPRDFGIERIIKKSNQRLSWETDATQPYALSVYSGRTPSLKAVLNPRRVPKNPEKDGELEATAILAGGDPFSPTLPVKPSVLRVVNHLNPGLSAEIPESIGGRRAALAEWVTHPANPLTPRVMVNRIWQGHFGRAIAGNPNNFGATGRKPTHPELLDWLAATFVEKDWSVKEMHRLILTSEAYRRSCVHPDPKAVEDKDPDGMSYAVFTPRRLTAEELRDSMLAVSGELNPRIGGLPARPEMNLEAALQPRQVMGSFAEAWQPNIHPKDRHRRSIYVLRIRGQLDPKMEVFNAPSPDLSCEFREASTVTPQVFSLFNSRNSYDRATALAARVKAESSSRQDAVERAFLLVNSRQPTNAETKACLEHWDRMIETHRQADIDFPPLPTEVVREAVEENTGVRFDFVEQLPSHERFVSDKKISDLDPETRGLAELCLVLLNANEFIYLY
ncbi:hypothetical protein HAHE_42490 [Haloferula helveola]|uniref:Cytochrome c domain-containing protein n=1 Tax=Haloferula helveola TaxID=490095 RepID=A0ABN6H9J7_9BACT|nr:hypothetical protein HAHE_42490 [Haloferula helveola]